LLSERGEHVREGRAYLAAVPGAVQLVGGRAGTGTLGVPERGQGEDLGFDRRPQSITGKGRQCRQVAARACGAGTRLPRLRDHQREHLAGQLKLRQLPVRRRMGGLRRQQPRPGRRAGGRAEPPAALGADVEPE
jgi:hypothetical protein